MDTPSLMQQNELFSSDSAGGANALASAAVDADVSVNNSGVSNSDSADGASRLASAAANAGLINLMCHNSFSFIPCHVVRSRKDTERSLLQKTSPYGQV